MDTVGGTVGLAAGGSASSILAAATAAGSGMTNASAVSASKTEAMTNAVNSAVKSASSSISTGLNAIGSLDGIVSANAADRANSGTVALNQITAANNQMRGMMQQAMLSAAENATSFSGEDVTDPLYSGNLLQSVTGQLESWNSYSASQTVGLSNFEKDTQTGVSTEEQKLAQKLFQTGLAVSNQTYALQGLLKSMSDDQSELEYRMSRLGRAVESFDKVVPRTGIVSAPFSTSDIASLAVSNATVTSQISEEKKGLSAAESQVDAWLSSAR
jgi:hypothetical protein